MFSEPRDGDAELAAALRRSVPVTLAAVATPFAIDDRRNDSAWLRARSWRATGDVPAHVWHDVRLPLPELVEHSAIGIVTVVPDEDGLVRRVPAMNRIDDAFLPALPLAAQIATKDSQPAVSATSSVLRAGDREWPIDRGGDVELIFAGVPHRTPALPFARLAEAALGVQDDAATLAMFRNKTVFIGSTALLLGDVNETPMGRVPGLMLAVHAYLSLAHGLVLAPRAWPWTLLLVLVALAPQVIMRNWRAESLILLTLAAGVGVTGAWLLELGFRATLRQPASVLTADLAGLTTFVLFLAEKIRSLRVTRLKLTSERLAAERAASLKSEFLAHVSHELRTPLTAILGFSGVLAEESSLASDKRALVQIIRRNGEQLLWLVNNLLDQARIAAGQMSIEPRPTAVRDVVEQVTATMAGVPRRPGVELQSSCAPETPGLLEVDGLRLQQIVINLAANALKFTEQGEVRVALSWDRGWLDVQVQDTGPGISATALAEVFEPFNQGDATSATRGGTGLGLTISRNLARLMGGDLTAQSIVGQGSTFRVRIPARSLDRDASSPADATPLTAATVNSTMAVGTLPLVGASQLRALVADDSEDIRALMQIFLKRLGLETLSAENGRAAVEKTLSEWPDIVLMDIQMPEMDGVEAVRAMRQAGYLRSVVALTAGSGDQLEHELLDAGFSAVVFKPVTSDELTQVIVRLLERTPATATARGARG